MIDPSLYACAPHVAPATLASIIRVESSGNPIAINVNVIRGRPRYPVPRIRSADHAAAVAHHAISQGYNVDLGLMQVNSRNLRNLGYSVEQMLSDQCLNVKAGAQILTENYTRAVRERGHGQGALLAALSAYNTGNFQNGFRNGYIARYFNGSSVALRSVQVAPADAQEEAPPPPNPFTSDISVYTREMTRNDTSEPARNDPAPDPVGED